MTPQERVDHFQQLLTRLAEDNRRLAEITEEVGAAVERAEEFERYYTGGQWAADVEAGLSPSSDVDFTVSLPSEDAPWEQLTASFRVREQLHEVTRTGR